MPKNFFQDIADKLQASLPDGVKNIQEEAEQLVKERVDSALANFKLVRYDDFEIQQKVLLKTREKLEQLTQRVEILESLLAAEMAKNGDVAVIDESLSVIQEEDSVVVVDSTQVDLITTQEEESSAHRENDSDNRADHNSKERKDNSQ